MHFDDRTINVSCQDQYKMIIGKFQTIPQLLEFLESGTSMRVMLIGANKEEVGEDELKGECCARNKKMTG